MLIEDVFVQYSFYYLAIPDFRCRRPLSARKKLFQDQGSLVWSRAFQAWFAQVRTLSDSHHLLQEATI